MTTTASTPTAFADLRMTDDPVGRRIDDAGEDRHASVHHLHRMLEDRAPGASSWNTTSLVEPSTKRPCTPPSMQMFDDAWIGGIVDLEVLGQGRDDGRNDAVEIAAWDRDLPVAVH